MQVAGIYHVVLRVRDLERAVAFYRDVLGCAVAHRQDHLGLVHLRAGASLIDLVSLDGGLGRAGGAGPGAEGRNMDHLCLCVADFDADRIRQELLGHGVQTGEVGQRYGGSGEALSIYLKDPDGNGLELRPGRPA